MFHSFLCSQPTEVGKKMGNVTNLSFLYRTNVKGKIKTIKENR